MGIRLIKADATKKRLELYAEDPELLREYTFFDRYDKKGSIYTNISETEVTCRTKFLGLFKHKIFCPPKAKRGLGKKYAGAKRQLISILKGSAGMVKSYQSRSGKSSRVGTLFGNLIDLVLRPGFKMTKDSNGIVRLRIKADVDRAKYYNADGYLYKSLKARCKLKKGDICEEGAKLFIKVKREKTETKISFHYIRSPELLQLVGAIVAAGL